MRGRTLLVASVGNSAAVLFSGGKPTRLTSDDEKLDAPPAGLVSTTPELVERELTPNDEFVLLASDGVWE